MLYDLTKQLLDSDGALAAEGDKPLTMQLVAVRGLLADVSASGGQLTPDEKLKRYVLFKKLSGGDSVELTADEASTCAAACGVFPPLVYGQMSDFFNQKD
jgi:hypothetical protein